MRFIFSIQFVHLVSDGNVSASGLSSTLTPCWSSCLLLQCINPITRVGSDLEANYSSFSSSSLQDLFLHSLPYVTCISFPGFVAQKVLSDVEQELFHRPSSKQREWHLHPAYFSLLLMTISMNLVFWFFFYFILFFVFYYSIGWDPAAFVRAYTLPCWE